MKTEGVNVYLTIDREQEGWDGHVGLFRHTSRSSADTNKTHLPLRTSIMIKLPCRSLIEMGFSENRSTPRWSCA